MSEDLKSLNVFDIFSQTQETLQEAEEKARKETSKKIERFRISEDGEYVVRILPLAPVVGPDGKPIIERKGYEYPLRQTFLDIKLPTAPGKKPKSISVPVINSTQKPVSKSLDIIDEYSKIARELYSDDEALMKKLDQGSYVGGLRWGYVHLLYVLDLEKDQRKGPLLWQISGSLYKEIETKKLSLWRREEQRRDKKISCPVSSFNAAAIIVNRTNENGKVKYIVDIDRYEDKLSEEELNRLMDAPRISDIIYRFTRYHLEAELEFLKQFDERNGINVCSQKDFKEAYDKLYKELPADDTSHFSFDKSTGDDKKSDVDDITIDDLWAEFDKMQEAEVDPKSQQYSDFREKLRMFAESKKLDVRLSHSKNNQQILEDIEKAEEEGRYIADKEDEKEEESEKPKRERKPIEDGPEDEKVQEEQPKRRRPRPSMDDEEQDGKPIVDEDSAPAKSHRRVKEEPEPEQVEPEQPKRPERKRR